MIGRVVNVMIPRQLGIVTDELTGDGKQPRKSPYSSTNGSENAMGQFTCIRITSIHAREYGSCRSPQILRMDPRRTSTPLNNRANDSIPTANYLHEHSNTSILCLLTFTSTRRQAKS